MLHKPPPYRNLDPGIVAAVRFLNEWSYLTTDSGDGVSKPEFARVIPFPHVVVRVPVPANLIIVADSIALLPWEEVVNGRPTMIEASYSAIDCVAVVMVGWP